MSFLATEIGGTERRRYRNRNPPSADAGLIKSRLWKIFSCSSTAMSQSPPASPPKRTAADVPLSSDEGSDLDDVQYAGERSIGSAAGARNSQARGKYKMNR